MSRTLDALLSRCGDGELFGVAQQFAELETGLVELGFAVAGGALEHAGDLVMFEAFDVVEDEDHAIARGERGDGALEGDAVDRAGELLSRQPKSRFGASSSEGLMVSSSETRFRPFLRRCISTRLTVRRCSQVEKALSPRKLPSLRKRCRKASWVMSSASETLPSMRRQSV